MTCTALAAIGTTATTVTTSAGSMPTSTTPGVMDSRIITGLIYSRSKSFPVKPLPLHTLPLFTVRFSVDWNFLGFICVAFGFTLRGPSGASPHIPIGTGEILVEMGQGCQGESSEVRPVQVVQIILKPVPIVQN